jgi:ketosteroid isomerase-like protein
MTPTEVCLGYLAAFATGNPEAVAAHVTDDFANEHLAALGSGCVGVDEYRRRLPGFLAFMSGLRYEVADVERDVIAQQDRVCIGYTLHAVVDGHTVAVPGVMRFEVREGRIARRIDCWDSLVFQRQVGQA